MKFLFKIWKYISGSIPNPYLLQLTISNQQKWVTKILDVKGNSNIENIGHVWMSYLDGNECNSISNAICIIFDHPFLGGIWVSNLRET